MPKSLPAQVITEMNLAQKRPCLLFELGLSSTLCFAAYKVNVTFPTGGNVYTAKAMELGGVSQSLEGQIQRVTVKFDNVSRDMAAYADHEDFLGKSLVIKRVYLDTVGDASYYNEVFRGSIERPVEIDRHWLTVTATAGKGLDRKLATFHYQRQCPWKFGGTECNTDGKADLNSLKASGTADSGATTTLVDNALMQAEDYWNYGEIRITKAGATYRRIVADFGTGTVRWTIPLPFAVDSNCTYVIYKGCDKTWDTCGAGNAWGPSSDNSANFGGCIHISKER
jgi:hypothetical protein